MVKKEYRFVDKIYPDGWIDEVEAKKGVEVVGGRGEDIISARLRLISSTF